MVELWRQGAVVRAVVLGAAVFGYCGEGGHVEGHFCVDMMLGATVRGGLM